MSFINRASTLSRAERGINKKLYNAVKEQDMQLVATLLEGRGDPNARCGKRGTVNAMNRAATQGNKPLEQLLIKHGGIPDPSSVKAAGGYETVKCRVKRGSAPAVRGNPNPWRESTSSLAAGLADSLKAMKLETLKSTGGITDLDASSSTDADEVVLPPAQAKIAAGATEIERGNLELGKQLGEGMFGVVVAGNCKGLVPGEAVTRVAVKQLNNAGDGEMDFFKEIKIMQGFTDAKKVVKLLGTVTKTKPFLMVMELMPRGDLKTVLRAARPKKTVPSRYSFSLLAAAGADVAEGMTYLSNCKIIHRDLATRNCLVDTTYTVKIGDFGLTRSMYEKEYYRKTGATALPIRWMSPESLEDGVYSSATDVWSFGILLWEIMTFAKLPYGVLTNHEVAEQVCDEEYRLEFPKGAPQPLYDIALNCWEQDASDRATFSDLHRTLSGLVKTLSAEALRHRKDPKAKASGASIAPQPQMSEKVLSMTGAHNRADVQEDEGAGYMVPGKSDTSASYLKLGDGNESDDSFSGFLGGLYDNDEVTAEYYKAVDKDDPDNQALYQDTRLAHLGSMALAIAMADEAGEVQGVGLEPSQGTTVFSSRTAREETTTATMGGKGLSRTVTKRRD